MRIIDFKKRFRFHEWDLSIPFIVLLGIIVTIFYFLGIRQLSINPDAGYYFWYLKNISDGHLPGVDFHTIYMPLSFYIMSPLFLIKNLNYLFLFGYMIIIQIINGYLIFRITKFYSKSFKTGIIAFLIFLLMTFHSDGMSFVLEPFVNLFGLISIYGYIKFKDKSPLVYLGLGILSILPFFCKQYGLVYAFVVPLFITIDLNDNRRILKSLGCFFVGLSLPLSTLVFLYHSKGINFKSLIEQFSGTGYGLRSLSSYLYGNYVYIKIYGCLLILAFLRIYKKGLFNHILVYLLIIVGFSLEFYFNNYPHYYQLMIPATIILSVIVYHDFHSGLEKWIVNSIIFYVLVINIYASNNYFKRYKEFSSLTGGPLKQQEQIAYHLNREIGCEKFIIYDSELSGFNVLLNEKSISYKEYGPIAHGFIDDKNYLSFIKENRNIIIRQSSVIRFFEDFKSDRNNWAIINISKGIVLLKRKQ